MLNLVSGTQSCCKIKLADVELSVWNTNIKLAIGSLKLADGDIFVSRGAAPLTQQVQRVRRSMFGQVLRTPKDTRAQMTSRFSTSA